MLTDHPEKPRNAVFGLRSYAGSRAAFLLTAESLFAESPGVKLTGDSTIEIYGPEGSTAGFMAASILCSSRLSLTELQALGQGIEDRLADPQAPRARSTLRVDLMWVEGVEVKTQDLQLPHPDLLTKSWALSTFVRAAENAIDSRVEAKRIVAAMEKVRGPNEVRGIPMLPPEVEISNGSPSRGTWNVEGEDWPDGLAAAAYTVGLIRWAMDAAPTSSGDPVIEARNAAKRVRSDGLVRLEAAAEADASDSEMARHWLEAVRDALRASKMRIATAVVYQAEGGHIRGAVLGERLPRALEDVTILSTLADRDPPDTRAWAKAHGFANITRVGLEVELPHREAGSSEATTPR